MTVITGVVDVRMRVDVNVGAPIRPYDVFDFELGQLFCDALFFDRLCEV